MNNDFDCEFEKTVDLTQRLDSGFSLQNEKMNELLKLYQAEQEKVVTSKLSEHMKWEALALEKRIKSYRDKIPDIIKGRSAAFLKVEYAVGSDMHRGYYCPSPIQDLVIGNCHRGRLLKRLTVRSKPSHEYCFDFDGTLRYVNDGDPVFKPFRFEYIDYADKAEYGITVETQERTISFFTESRFDTSCRIVSYCEAQLSPDGDGKVDLMDRELYKYGEDGRMKGAECIRFTNFRKKPFVDYHRYAFEHDSEGYLTSYRIYPSFDPHSVYEINIKRKI